MRQVRFAIALIVCAAVAAAASATAPARTIRPDLAVTKASVKMRGTTLSGSFSVRSSRRKAGAGRALWSKR